MALAGRVTPSQARMVSWMRRVTFEMLIGTGLLIDEMLGAFDPRDYPELASVTDKFCFHCGLPARGIGSVGPAVYMRDVEQVGETLDFERSRDVGFRDYIVGEVLPKALPDADERLEDAVDLFLDGALRIGVDSGPLSLHGGVGNNSTTQTVDNWRKLDIETLGRLFGVGQQDSLACRISLKEGSGVVSDDGKHAATFAGMPVDIHISARMDEGQLEGAQYSVRCRRAGRPIGEVISCEGARLDTTVTIQGEELRPGRGHTSSLLFELLRFEKTVCRVRLRVDICSDERPGVLVLEPGFHTFNLVTVGVEDQVDLTSRLFRDPVTAYVLVCEPESHCNVSIDGTDCPTKRLSVAGGGQIYSLLEPINVERFPGGEATLEIRAGHLGHDVALESEDVELGEFTIEDELRVATARSSKQRMERVMLAFRDGDAPLWLARLGKTDAASRRRETLAKHFETTDGWKPILCDFVDKHSDWSDGQSLKAGARYKASSAVPQFLLSAGALPAEMLAGIRAYEEARECVLDCARALARRYQPQSERALYVTVANWVQGDDGRRERAVADYLEAYLGVLSAAPTRPTSHAQTGSCWRTWTR